jgi:Ca2+-binding RTX toxin-like protein
MQFDSADVAYMISKNLFDAVILHEMGHVLGLGSMWAMDGLKVGIGYVGVHALDAYRTLASDPTLFIIPIETNGGAGTAGVHWSEAFFNTEIMTGYADTVMPISTMTIGALQDLGYSVDYTQADPYVLPLAGIVLDPILSGLFLNRNQITAGDDILVGTTGNNVLSGSAGNDLLYGLTGADTLRGGAGNDLLDGNTGNDLLIGGLGNNSLTGGTDNDTLLSGYGNDWLDGGTGNDILTAGAGNDYLDGGTGDDNLSAGQGKDTLLGNTGDDILNAASGNDVLDGGTGVDVLIGGLGKDNLTGGTGADIFTYQSLIESGIYATGRDVITDFVHSDGDKIDVSTIDADVGMAGLQNFSYISTDGFSAAAQIRFNPALNLLSFSNDADIAPEMTILLIGITTFQLSDLLL